MGGCAAAGGRAAGPLFALTTSVVASIHSAGTNDLGRPFGYLKPSSAGDTVNLLVLPYDYPTLSVLMHQVGADRVVHGERRR